MIYKFFRIHIFLAILLLLIGVCSINTSGQSVVNQYAMIFKPFKIDFSANGRLIASASKNELVIQDVNSRQIITRRQGRLYGFAWTSDSVILLSTMERTILFDVINGVEFGFPLNSVPYTLEKIIVDNNKAYGISKNGKSICCIEFSKGRIIQAKEVISFETKDNKKFNSLSVLNGKLLVSVSASGKYEVYMWDHSSKVFNPLLRNLSRVDEIRALNERILVIDYKYGLHIFDTLGSAVFNYNLFTWKSQSSLKYFVASSKSVAPIISVDDGVIAIAFHHFDMKSEFSGLVTISLKEHRYIDTLYKFQGAHSKILDVRMSYNTSRQLIVLASLPGSKDNSITLFDPDSKTQIDLENYRRVSISRVIKSDIEDMFLLSSPIGLVSWDRRTLKLSKVYGVKGIGNLLFNPKYKFWFTLYGGNILVYNTNWKLLKSINLGSYSSKVGIDGHLDLVNGGKGLSIRFDDNDSLIFLDCGKLEVIKVVNLLIKEQNRDEWLKLNRVVSTNDSLVLLEYEKDYKHNRRIVLYNYQAKQVVDVFAVSADRLILYNARKNWESQIESRYSWHDEFWRYDNINHKSIWSQKYGDLFSFHLSGQGRIVRMLGGYRNHRYSHAIQLNDSLWLAAKLFGGLDILDLNAGRVITKVFVATNNLGKYHNDDRSIKSKRNKYVLQYIYLNEDGKYFGSGEVDRHFLFKTDKGTIFQPSHYAKELFNFQSIFSKIGASEINRGNYRDTPRIELKEPEIILCSTGTFKLLTHSNVYPLNFKIRNCDVGSLVLTVNGVEVKNERLKNTHYHGSVNLIAGDNVIEAQVIGESGKSNRYRVVVRNLSGDEKVKLYLIGIGVSAYRDSSLNLRYARDDIESIVRSYLYLNSRYDSIVVLELYDQQVHDGNQLKDTISKFLKHAEIHDQVHVYFAGHGFISRKNELVLGTYSTSTSDDYQGGVKFNELHDILIASPSISKFLYLDACNTGRTDKDISRRPSLQSNLKGRRGARPVNSSVEPQMTHQQLIDDSYYGTNQGRGLNILAASGAREAAFESNELQHGVMSYFFLEAMFNEEADFDKNGVIQLNEAINYVKVHTIDYTAGNQIPETRQYNHYSNFTLSKPEYDLGFSVINAINKGDRDFVKSVIGNNEHHALALDRRYGKYRLNALHFAVLHQRLSIIKLLERNGADINMPSGFKGYTPLHFAVGKGYLSVVKLLCIMGADTGIKSADSLSPIGYAKVKGNEEIVKALKNPEKAKQELTLWNQLFINIKNRDKKAIVLLCANDGNNLNIQHPVYSQGIIHLLSYEKDKYELLNWLLSEFPNQIDLNNVNGNGLPPLYIAIHRGNTKTVQLLLKAGADPGFIMPNGRSVQSYLDEMN